MALGAAVGHAVLGPRLGKRALLYGALLGTLPDLDILIPMGGPIEDFTYHRGASHSWFVHGLLTPLLALPLWRVHRDRGPGYGPWLLFVWAILFTHALLDVFTVYGTQIFWPLPVPPAALGSIFIIDPAYTLPLLVGCGVASWAKDARRGRRANRLGLILSTLYLLWSVGAQQWVLSEARASLAERGVAPQHLLATPAPFNTLLWRLVAIDGDRHLEGVSSLVDGAPVEWQAYARNTALVHGLHEEWSLQRLDWFTHGFWAAQREGDDVLVEDLRMGLAPDYVFRFRVGQIVDGTSGQQEVAPAAIERRTRRYDLSRLQWVFARIWAPVPSP